MAILKHTHDLSDEVLCERWLENPYYQLFCGEEFFRHRLPFDRSSLTRWRQRMGEEKLTALLQESLSVATRAGAAKPADFTRVIVDTTVQPKAVAFPTDARLLQRARERLVRLAQTHGVRLRQSYRRAGKRALIQHQRYAHAKQFRRANRALRTLRTLLGRVIRDIARKIGEDPRLRAIFAWPLSLARRVLPTEPAGAADRRSDQAAIAAGPVGHCPAVRSVACQPRALSRNERITARRVGSICQKPAPHIRFSGNRDYSTSSKTPCRSVTSGLFTDDYVDPPAHAVVLSIDEKSQIQALDRGQPGLPTKKGRCGTMTHDYKRHGTTTLFAALNTLDGSVIGRCMQRHRHQEFIRFLDAVEREVPTGKLVHAIVDNYAAHKHPKVRAWLGRYKRWTFHFTPTSASWLNAVEGFFARLTRRRLKRGVFCSIVDLQAAINRFLAETNDDSKPFIWTANPDKIIAAVRRGASSVGTSGTSSLVFERPRCFRSGGSIHAHALLRARLLLNGLTHSVGRSERRIRNDAR